MMEKIGKTTRWHAIPGALSGFYPGSHRVECLEFHCYHSHDGFHCHGAASCRARHASLIRQSANICFAWQRGTLIGGLCSCCTFSSWSPNILSIYSCIKASSDSILQGRKFYICQSTAWGSSAVAPGQHPRFRQQMITSRWALVWWKRIAACRR